MDNEILMKEFENSDAGRVLIAQHEKERQAKRRAMVEGIAKAEREYDALREGLDPRIETAQKAIKEFRKKFEAAREEANRLASEKRIGYINRDNLVSTQQGLLRESAHSAIQVAIDMCREKLKGLKGDSGENRKKDLWGIFRVSSWSNAAALNVRRTVIREVIGRLEAMQLEVTEDEPAEVKKLMASIPRDPLQVDHDEWTYNPEEWRLKRYPSRSARV